MGRRAWIAGLLLAQCLQVAHAAVPDAKALDAEIARAMSATGAKGLALAVIDDGHVVHARSYGVRNAAGEALQDDTILYGASLTKADAGRALEAFVATVEKGLKKGDTISIVGFGSFTVRKRAARTGRNPRTGAYAHLVDAGRDLTDLHALICPRPFLISGGSEDPSNVGLLSTMPAL